VKKYNSTVIEKREDTTRYNRQFTLSADIEQHVPDSQNTMSQYKTTTGRPPSPNVASKTPPSGRSSPSSLPSHTSDPFHIDKNEWMTLSTPTKEKINAMRKQLRDYSSSHIQLLRTNDEQEADHSSPQTNPPMVEDTEVDPFGDTIQQFLVRAHRQFTLASTRVRPHLNITTPFHILRQVVNPVNGRLISDSGADTGAISDTYAHIIAIHDAQIAVDGCHPTKPITYNLCDGIVAVDYCNNVYLLGIRGVPLIPQSVGLLLSELQARAHGIKIDSRPRIFGGKGCISISDSIDIPLYLEHGLISCPIRKPSLDEVNTLQDYWLTGDQLWDPSTYDEYNISTGSIPQGYQSTPNRGNIHLSRSSPKLPEAQSISRFLLYRPSDIIERTLECTTRLATSIGDPQFRRHFKSRFPLFNRPRLQETYVTDTWFANTRAIDGYTCAQLFYGTTSRFIVIYPMKREGDGPNILQDFIGDHGSPFILRSDNSRMQSGQLWTTIYRKYNIKQTFTEPYHPHQNPAERYIGHVKDLVTTILDRTGAPDKFWAFCAIYVAYILNRMAHPLLQHRTPFERRHGYTPDISTILRFSFWDSIYFFDCEASFPQSRQRSGHFIGFTESIGDALTYWVYDDTTHQVLARSVVRSSLVQIKRLEANVPRDHDHTASPPVPLLVGNQELFPNTPLVEFDPLDHSGYPKIHHGTSTPTIPAHPPASQVQQGSRVSIYWPDDDASYPGTVTGITNTGLVQVSYDDGDIEELDLANENFQLLPPLTTTGDSTTTSRPSDLHINSETDDSYRWKISRILEHKELGPHKTDLHVQWDSGESSWLPLSMVKRSDPHLYETYALTAHGPWANNFRKKRRQCLSWCSNIFKNIYRRVQVWVPPTTFIERGFGD